MGLCDCVDFRRLNKETVPDPYLMPRVEEIIDCLGEAMYVSTLDLNKGFHQVPDDIEKTAFCTPWGKYEYLFMPFGLRNVPSTFQRLMDLVLDDLLDFARSYIDDIAIFSKTWTEHLQQLKAVLERLRKVKLTAKPIKCKWAYAFCSYLGHVVGRGLIRPEDCKVAAVKNFLQPVTKSDVRSYLGLTGYYRKFIRDYAREQRYSATEAEGLAVVDAVDYFAVYLIGNRLP